MQRLNGMAHCLRAEYPGGIVYHLDPDIPTLAIRSKNTKVLKNILNMQTRSNTKLNISLCQSLN